MIWKKKSHLNKHFYLKKQHPSANQDLFYFFERRHQNMSVIKRNHMIFSWCCTNVKMFREKLSKLSEVFEFYPGNTFFFDRRLQILETHSCCFLKGDTEICRSLRLIKWYFPDVAHLSKCFWEKREKVFEFYPNYPYFFEYNVWVT